MAKLVQEDIFVKILNNRNKLDVVKSEIIDAQELTWNELFTGFNVK